MVGSSSSVEGVTLTVAAEEADEELSDPGAAAALVDEAGSAGTEAVSVTVTVAVAGPAPPSTPQPASTLAVVGHEVLDTRHGLR